MAIVVLMILDLILISRNGNGILLAREWSNKGNINNGKMSNDPPPATHTYITRIFNIMKCISSFSIYIL